MIHFRSLLYFGIVTVVLSHVLFPPWEEGYVKTSALEAVFSDLYVL
jgi:hypothetical protein